MSLAAGVYVDTIMRRVRDEDAVGITRAFVRDILNRTQRMVNAELMTEKESVTLTTNPFQQFYPVTALAPASVRVEFVREGNRDLRKVRMADLTHTDTRWFRKLGTKFEVWAPVGRDMIVVYPAKFEVSSVEVVYTKLTDQIVNDATITELPEDDMTHAVDLAEVLMLVKQRRYEMLEPVVKQFMDRSKTMRDR